MANPLSATIQSVPAGDVSIIADRLLSMQQGSVALEQ
jgi:hypothetical protein